VVDAQGKPAAAAQPQLPESAGAAGTHVELVNR